MRHRLQFSAVLGAFVILGGSYLVNRADGASAAGTPIVPYAAGTTLMDSIRIEDPGIKASEPGLLSASQAVEMAADAAGRLADANKPRSVQLAIVTNDTYGTVDENGRLTKKFVDHRLCWVVRFTGTPQPVYGGLRKDFTAMADHAPQATELNVALDAMTGEVLMMFSFQ